MTDLLHEFTDAGLIDAADTAVARRLCAITGDTDPTVALAVALLVSALRGGSVCLDLRQVRAHHEQPDGAPLAWPDPEAWLAAVRASPLAGTPPALRFLDDLLYFDRYWLEEQQVCADVSARLTEPAVQGPAPDLTRLFPAEFGEQRAAAQVAVAQRLTILTGGPGTGKTTTVARLLAAVAEQAELAGGSPPRTALAAPTGKAAARLAEAVQLEIGKLPRPDRDRLAGLQATTLHRLLGSRPDTSSRFRHHRNNRLPHDVVVVDETSMVSLTMMARLLEAVRPDARLVLVGDPDQLASVDAGAVLADLVDGLGAAGVVELRTSHRFGQSIGRLAAAIRAGDADGAVDLLSAGGEAVEWIDSDDAAEALRPILVTRATQLQQAALLGDSAGALTILDGHRLLCAHRRGPFGVALWNRRIERWLGDATGQSMWSPWYPGRPLLVTANDYGLGVYNGDTGVVVAAPEGLRAHIGSKHFVPGRLGEVETMFAMTIHKSQGSQADEVTVLLPPPESRLLTRELFYTAVTRAQHRVRVVGTESAVRAAIDRRAMRASGLGRRLSAVPAGRG
ncbi:exodeoxyribonuclease V subunit alpha [Mycobacterium sp. Y57]|uniref:exodeoxyribonuclease V subunit alpha n=1 Tax=Mycolicibacterium xanthum TaxID=2796469 RepID=UPI001C86048A|nr:exodeoxyribonuclease V subunit alpha [Mycolicibacterium xanthum]MBX7432243.1 exodeoxyribonuclease V subunit alpha [Mycolicibacterium xanthum]